MAAGGGEPEMLSDDEEEVERSPEASPPVAAIVDRAMLHSQFISQALQGQPKSHLLIKRCSSMLRCHFEVREPIVLPNGLIKANRLFAVVHKCLKKKKHSSYQIYEANESRSSASEADLIGKLKSDDAVSSYTLCSGRVPMDGEAKPHVDHKGRVQITSISYTKDKEVEAATGLRAPMRMTAEINDPDGTVRPLSTVAPEWDGNLHAYKIDFKERQYNSADVLPSSKNHKLQYEGSLVMQMVKVGPQLFSVEFGWPLSGLQALGIALTRFDTRFL